MSAQTVSAIQVFCGIVFMIASISLGLRTNKTVPDELRGRWKVMTCLMFSFLLGYAAFLVILIRQIAFPLELVTGSVFFGGSVFVYLVISLSRSTIGRLRGGRRQIREANGALFKKNALLEREIRERRAAEEALQSAAADLEARVTLRTAELTETLLALRDEASERKKAEKAINDSHAELQQIFNSAADGMRVVNRDYDVLRVNETFQRLSGFRQEYQVGKKCYEIFYGKQCHTDKCPMNRVLAGEERLETETVKTRPDGESFSCLLTATPYRDPEGRVVGIVEDFRDISERKAMEIRLQQMTITDELTGLLNRRGFMMLAANQLGGAERNGSEIYLLYADLDGLKWINDSLGHEAGDQALREAASVLHNSIRKADILGRLGGDEFAILLTSTADVGEGAHPVIELIERNVDELNRRKGRGFDLSISAGMVRRDPLLCSALESLMAEADALMYENKRKKKNLRAS